MAATAQRATAIVVLLVAGVVSLPVSAFFLDGQGTENWILPVQLVVMALIGAAVGRLMPGLAGPGATTQRATVVGVVVGLVCALVGVLLFFLLLSGFEGA